MFYEKNMYFLICPVLRCIASRLLFHYPTPGCTPSETPQETTVVLTALMYFAVFSRSSFICSSVKKKKRKRKTENTNSTSITFFYRLVYTYTCVCFYVQIFQRYLTFCAIGIQNAQLFEKSVQEFQRNQVSDHYSICIAVLYRAARA